MNKVVLTTQLYMDWLAEVLINHSARETDLLRIIVVIIIAKEKSSSFCFKI